MSDELDIAKGTGIGAAAMALIGVLWSAFVRRSEKASDKVDADRDAKLLHLEKRLEGVAKDHGERLRSTELKLENVDTRLRSREGVQGVQHTNIHTLTPEMLRIIERIGESEK